MNSRSAWRVAGALAVVLAALTGVAGEARADRVGLFKTKDGVSIRYHVVTPFPYVKDKAYPSIIAFVGGDQGADDVKTAVDDYWGPEARKRGYLVFLPEAPKGYVYYGRGVFLVPELIEHYRQEFKIEGDKLHMAGNSNGGLSAFRIALKSRSRIKTLTVFPGFPAFTRDFHRLTRLKNIKVNMFVNDVDERWKDMMDFTHERLKTLGVDVNYQVMRGDGHKIDGLAGANAKLLFDALERK